MRRDDKVPVRKKIRYLVPNSFTAFSLLLGLFSIFFTLDGKLELAAWLILWCTLLDKLDGLAARLMDATSDFGVEFDSFADFVAFGLAPGFLVYQYAIKAPTLSFLPIESDSGFIWFFRVAAAVYILAAGIRLATFNVKTNDLGPDWFYGFPSTYCGGVLASFLLTASKYGFVDTIAPWMPLVVIPLGMLMLTPIRLPKIKARRSRYMNLLQAVAGGLIYLFGFLRKFPEFLFIVAVFYLLIGVAVGRKATLDERTDDDPCGPQDPEPDFS